MGRYTNLPHSDIHDDTGMWMGSVETAKLTYTNGRDHVHPNRWEIANPVLTPEGRATYIVGGVVTNPANCYYCGRDLGETALRAQETIAHAILSGIVNHSEDIAS